LFGIDPTACSRASRIDRHRDSAAGYASFYCCRWSWRWSCTPAGANGASAVAFVCGCGFFLPTRLPGPAGGRPRFTIHDSSDRARVAAVADAGAPIVRRCGKHGASRRGRRRGASLAPRDASERPHARRAAVDGVAWRYRFGAMGGDRRGPLTVLSAGTALSLCRGRDGGACWPSSAWPSAGPARWLARHLETLDAKRTV